MTIERIEQRGREYASEASDARHVELAVSGVCAVGSGVVRREPSVVAIHSSL